MAFDKKLLPEGAITLQEFMEKHDPREIENYKVSYLLPDGKPLEFEGMVLEGVEVVLAIRGIGAAIKLRHAPGADSTLAQKASGWCATFDWGGKVDVMCAAESVIAVLDYHKPQRIGKPADEWLAMEDFDPLWLEGARFEGREGCLTCISPSSPSLRLAVGWNSRRGLDIGPWGEDVGNPWIENTRLYLTPENEAKALGVQIASPYRVPSGHHEGWYDLTRLMADGRLVNFEALHGTDFRLRFKGKSAFWVQGRFTNCPDAPNAPASNHWHWWVADELRKAMSKAWSGQDGMRILVREVTFHPEERAPMPTVCARDLPDDSVVEAVNQENGDVRIAHVSTGRLRGTNGALLSDLFAISRVLYHHKQEDCGAEGQERATAE